MKKSKAYLNYLRSKVGLNNGDSKELDAVDADVRWPYGDNITNAPHNDIDTKIKEVANNRINVEFEDDNDLDDDLDDESLEEAKKWKWVIRRDDSGVPKKIKKWYSDRDGFKIENDGKGHVREVKYSAQEELKRARNRRKAKPEFLANKNSNVRKANISKKIRERLNLDDKQ